MKMVTLPLFEKVEMPLRAFTFHFYRGELGPTDSVQSVGVGGEGGRMTQGCPLGGCEAQETAHRDVTTAINPVN